MILDKYLKDRGITKRFFASKVGVSEVTLSRIIFGQVEPTLSTAISIEDATDGLVTCKMLVKTKIQKK